MYIHHISVDNHKTSILHGLKGSCSIKMYSTCTKEVCNYQIIKTAPVCSTYSLLCQPLEQKSSECERMKKHLTQTWNKELKKLVCAWYMYTYIHMYYVRTYVHTCVYERLVLCKQNYTNTWCLYMFLLQIDSCFVACVLKCSFLYIRERK